MSNPVPIDHLIKFVLNRFIPSQDSKINITDFYNDFLIYLASIKYTLVVNQGNIMSALGIYYPDYPVRRFLDGLYIVGLSYRFKSTLKDTDRLGIRINLSDTKCYYLNTASKVDRKEHIEK